MEGTEILKVEIDQYPSRKHNYFVATVRDVVGHVTDPGIDVLEVLESMDIVSEFPEEVLKEAEQVPDVPSEKDLEGRLDLRDEITLPSMGQMPKTWTMRSISSYSRTAILSWVFTSQMFLITLQKDQLLIRKL